MNDYIKSIKIVKICKISTICSFLIMLISIGFQIYISNSIALQGIDYKDLYELKINIEKDIALLQYNDSVLSSLSTIEKKAYEQGFIKMTEPLLAIAPPSLASLNIQ